MTNSATVIPFPARTVLVKHQVVTERWTLPDLRMAIISDLHICQPWTPLKTLGRIVEKVNSLGADLILLAGDFLVSRQLPARPVSALKIVEALSSLSAPLGVYAVLGNHDWWDCHLAQSSGLQRSSVREAFANSSITLLENQAIRLDPGFWLVGFDSQNPNRNKNHPGRHNPDAAFANVPDSAPAILLAHEPDYFAEGDTRAVLQVSGHTHGGQANFAGWRPLTPSAYGGRYAWGHIKEGGRHLVVSAGIGYSGLPFRLFQPPEITFITLTTRT